MKNPWDELAREQRRKGRWRVRLAAAGTLVAGVGLVGALGAALTGLSASNQFGNATPALVQAEISALRRELDDARGRLALAEVRLEHGKAVAKYSEVYRVPADLAEAIYDIALAEGLHPSLGFQLVKVESRFQPDARSERGAIGYTQLRLKTARGYDSTITERDLLDRDTNLRVGFRFLKDLIARFDQDVHLALVAYNRGPTRVEEMMTRGENPANGYAEIVLKGVKKGS
ncbi:MAG TPA: transglycosylase SLT domain-containing protein [Gemmatimonadales bacterium]|nr:transglycosylase SLT domain-containing protein [Gemmatimonadales bacterium]